MKLLDCIKLIIWHSFGGGIILIILRMVLILYFATFCFSSLVKVDTVFLKYILNPIGKKIINAKNPVLTGPVTNNPIRMFCLLPGIILFVIFSKVISRILQCIAFILTFGTMNKYYESIFNVNYGRIHLGVEIVKETEPNEASYSRPDIQKQTGLDNKDNQNKQPPQYDIAIKTIAPSAPPFYEEQMEGVQLTNKQIDGNDNDIKCWLKCVDEMHYGQYYTLFVKNGYDSMSVIQTMNEQELVDIGIERIGHRKKILLAIDKLNKQSNKPTIATTKREETYSTCCCGHFIVL